jgi:hypothetical protein
MVFSDTSTKLGIVQDCEQLVFGNYGDITGSSDRLYDFTARINRSYDKLATKIMAVDSRWQFDDTNQTDLPIGSTNIVSGQSNYSLSVEHLDIEKVVVYDSSGNKYVLNPYDINDPYARVVLEDITTDGGIPITYDKVGNSLILYPTPNYAYTNGLIVHFRRPPSYFTYTDTTKVVGVPALFHRYLSLDASLDYAISKQLTLKNDLAGRLKQMEIDLEEFYSHRNKDEQKIIKPVIRNSR